MAAINRPTPITLAQAGTLLTLHKMGSITFFRAAMLCISATYAVVRCLSVWLGVCRVRVLCRNGGVRTVGCSQWRSQKYFPGEQTVGSGTGAPSGVQRRNPGGGLGAPEADYSTIQELS